MAHGEFMAVGAYTTYFISSFTENYIPRFTPYYFLFAIIVSFIVAGLLGYFAEFALIRYLYKRPLDTLLATWGLHVRATTQNRQMSDAASLFGTIASAFSIAQAQSILEFFISGSMAKVYTLLALVIILMFKPESLFASKIRR